MGSGDGYISGLVWVELFISGGCLIEGDVRRSVSQNSHIINSSARSVTQSAYSCCNYGYLDWGARLAVGFLRMRLVPQFIIRPVSWVRGRFRS